MSLGSMLARLTGRGAVDQEVYVAWLVALYAVLAKIRREGLMAIEADTEDPEAADSVFARHPLVLRQPYLGFATDILRLMVGGNLNAKDVRVYARHAMRGLVAGGVADKALLECIWLPLWAAMKGYAPQVAVEFGRQAIPAQYKLGCLDLERAIRAARQAPVASAENVGPDDIGIRIDRFIASLGG